PQTSHSWASQGCPPRRRRCDTCRVARPANAAIASRLTVVGSGTVLDTKVKCADVTGDSSQSGANPASAKPEQKRPARLSAIDGSTAVPVANCAPVKKIRKSLGSSGPVTPGPRKRPRKLAPTRSSASGYENPAA